MTNPKTTVKKKRISCECDREEVAVVKEGARLDGRKVSNFLRVAALTRARRLIDMQSQKSLLYRAKEFMLEKEE